MDFRLSEILDAPCCFCGYNGAGYYQTNTHKEGCPFFKIGGSREREHALVVFARSNVLRVEMGWCQCTKRTSVTSFENNHWICDYCGEPIKKL